VLSGLHTWAGILSVKSAYRCSASIMRLARAISHAPRSNFFAMLKMVSSDVVVYTNDVVLRDVLSQAARVVWGMATAVAARPSRKTLNDSGCILSGMVEGAISFLGIVKT